MPTCLKCGECCRFFELTLKKTVLTLDFKQYLAHHNIEIHPDRLRLPVVCKHLKNCQCEIYSMRPKYCKEQTPGYWKGCPLYRGGGK